MSSDSSFLSRWSQRKALVRQGAVLPAEPVAEVDAPPQLASACLDERVADQAPEPPRAGLPAPAGASALETATEPPPTLAEAQALTPSSDFSRFVARGVDTPVKNAALKQLFRDPHFNVMDGLDTYIDDYGKPDPLPASMLRKMVQAHALGLFTEDPPPAPDASRGADPHAEPGHLALTPTETHENADLRLQPHDAAGRPCPEPGAEPDTGRTG
jgi:hypothetical protein